MSSQSSESSTMRRDLVLLVMQSLNEREFTETVHKLEQESGFYFNMKYFEEQVLNGNWDEVEKYLSGFTNIDDNEYSLKIYFGIRKQKYLEVLDKHDWTKAHENLIKDLKVFASINEDVFKALTQLLTLENFREHKELAHFTDNSSMRRALVVEFRKLIEANPLLYDKLQFPTVMTSRLNILINQSLHMQHKKCKDPMPDPEIKTLFVDHDCGQPIEAHNGEDSGTVDTISKIADKSKMENN